MNKLDEITSKERQEIQMIDLNDLSVEKLIARYYQNEERLEDLKRQSKKRIKKGMVMNQENNKKRSL